jgi:hypothetical protein
MADQPSLVPNPLEARVTAIDRRLEKLQLLALVTGLALGILLGYTRFVSIPQEVAKYFRTTAANEAEKRALAAAQEAEKHQVQLQRAANALDADFLTRLRETFVFPKPGEVHFRYGDNAHARELVLTDGGSIAVYDNRGEQTPLWHLSRVLDRIRVDDTGTIYFDFGERWRFQMEQNGHVVVYDRSTGRPKKELVMD